VSIAAACLSQFFFAATENSTLSQKNKQALYHQSFSVQAKTRSAKTFTPLEH
jgi:hypothetical protein